MNDLVLIQQPGTPATAEAMPPLTVIIERFLYSQDVRPQSRELYRRTLKQFFFFFYLSGHDLDQLTREHLLTYKQYLLDKGLSPLTVGSYITVLRLFYKFTSIHRIYRNIAEGIKLPRRPQGHRKQVLTEKEGKALLEHLSTQGARNKAIGATLIYTGIRTIELSRLLIKDLTIKQGARVLMIHGKGRDIKDRFITLNETAYQAIRQYLSTRPEALPGEPMFVSDSNNNRGKSISTTTISTIIKGALRACGLDDASLTAHSLRHTFGTSLIRAGAPVYEVSKAMGHTSINTTNIYISTIEDEMRLKSPVTDAINGIYD